jgi:KaiC/GvpD/RAD55 family RecA-like ATPase
MNARIENPAKKVKRFEDLLPKFDNGTTDWETAKARLSQNIDAAEIIFGKLPPQALEIEETVLGACLFEKEAFQKAYDVLAGFLNPFYTDAHNIIWRAMIQLNQKSETIDRLTVFAEMQRMLQTAAIGGTPFFLLELTEKVTSAVHIESHSRILLQTHLRRRLLHIGIKLVQNAYDSSTDLFEMIDEHLFCVQQLIEFNTVLKGYDMPTVLKMAEEVEPKLFLMGSLIKAGDIVIIFSGPENGKSILGIQAADKISRGESLWGGVLRNECSSKRVAYFDFELSLNDYKNRYIDGAGNHYPFLGDGSFIRIGNDEKNPKSFAEIAANMERILCRNIELHRPEVIFIDNITAMSNGSTADAAVVTKLMDLVMRLKKQYNLTVIVFAHTPKRYDLMKPLGIEDLAGSSLLAAYADSIVAIGRSKMGNNVKYIKHLKVRCGTKIHDEMNVIQVAIEKEGAFLQMKTLEEPFGRESDHLVSKNEIALNDEIVLQIVALHDEGKSNQAIKEALEIPMSRQHIGRIIKGHKDKREADTKQFDAALQTKNL